MQIQISAFRSFRAGDRCHWRGNPPVERYNGTISLAPRIYEGGGPRSGRGSSPAVAAGTLSVTLRVPALPKGEPRELRSVLAPRIYEGGGPRSGRGSLPRRRGRPSQSRFACQLPQRGSRGSCAPFLPPAFMRGEGHEVAGGVPRSSGKASSVTASPCQLPQRGSRERCAPFLPLCRAFIRQPSLRRSGCRWFFRFL